MQKVIFVQKYKTRNCDFSALYELGKQTTLDNDTVSAKVELSNTFNQSWWTIQDYLQQIDKVCRTGVWVPQNLQLIASAVE